MKLALAACLVVVGCGGSSGGSSNLTGAWAGTWNGSTAPPPGTSGTLQFTLSGTHATGKVQNSVLGEGDLTATIQSDGTFNGEVAYPSVTCPLNGSVGIKSGHLKGNLLMDSSRTINVYLFVVDLTRA